VSDSFNELGSPGRFTSAGRHRVQWKSFRETRLRGAKRVCGSWLQKRRGSDPIRKRSGRALRSRAAAAQFLRPRWGTGDARCLERGLLPVCFGWLRTQGPLVSQRRTRAMFAELPGTVTAALGREGLGAAFMDTTGSSRGSAGEKTNAPPGGAIGALLRPGSTRSSAA